MLKLAISAALNPVSWLAVFIAFGSGAFIGDRVGANREIAACNAAQLKQQLSDAEARVSNLTGDIVQREAAAKADAERFAADLAAARTNQDIVDATPPNEAACLDRSAVDRVFSVR